MTEPARTAKLSLSGWGNHPRSECEVYRPASVAALHSAVAGRDQGSLIARGLGRAYGDAAVNADQEVALMTGMNRFLGFDPSEAILDCEAGVSLGEIMAVFLPRGWFLPTTPGTKFVTIGGAIAADVHGKDHHRVGSFGNFVVDLQLLTTSGEVLTCSPSQNGDVFWATVGGMGLTGVILSARLRLDRVDTAYCNVTYHKTKDLDESLDFFESTEEKYRYSVAWTDCSAAGSRLGRSVVMAANRADLAALPDRLQANPLCVPAKRQWMFPFRFPGFAINNWSVKAFNTLYYSRNRNRTEIVDYDSYFYPLDAIGQWNRVYGRRGFAQYQALFPLETARRGLVELLGTLAQWRLPGALAVLKKTGPANDGMLSYLRPGITMAIDVPNRGESLRQAARSMDAILLKHGGRLYLAKDSLAEAGTIYQMYDRLDEFRAAKEKVDPQGRFDSSLARRLELVKRHD